MIVYFLTQIEADYFEMLLVADTSIRGFLMWLQGWGKSTI